MASKNSEAVDKALNLLPAQGSEVLFDDFKAQLQQADPDNWRPTFEYILKNELAGRKLYPADETHPAPRLMLSRK